MLLTAIVVAICVALGRGKVAYSWTGFGSVLGVGLIAGICMGKVSEAMIISAAIQTVYLGLTQSGGVITSDSVIGTAIAVPICLATGLDENAALALAIPVGVLAANLTTVIYILNGVFYRDALKKAADGNARGVTFDAVVWPLAARLILYGSVVFVGIYFGSALIQSIVDFIPEWFINGLTVAGGVLPIIGFALVINSIGRDDYIPYFIIGFFVIQYLNVPIMGIAIFSVCIALIKFFLNGQVDLSVLKGNEDAEKKKHLLTMGDVERAYWRWWWFVEVAHNYEGMQALAFCNSLIPALKKLYPEKEKLAAALTRHLTYFNTNGNYGVAIHGIVLAMEEENVLTGVFNDEELEATVNGLKSGLMGPLAAVGDTIDWGTWNKIFSGIGIAFAAEGSWIGAVLSPVCLLVVQLIEGQLCLQIGYRLGSDSISALFGGGLAKTVTDASGMIGMTMMGALASKYCSFTFAIEQLQKIVDAVAPGIVPLVLVFVLCWIVRHKTKNFALITFGMIAIALVLSLVGIC